MKTFKTLYLLAIMLTPFFADAQRPFVFTLQYQKLIEQAAEAMQLKEYAKSAQLYAKAFMSMNNKGRVDHLYDAACAFALSGDKEAAFRWLGQAVYKQGYANGEHMRKDADLTTLHTDARWKKVLLAADRKAAMKKKRLLPSLVKELDTIYESDQHLRRGIDTLIARYGVNSKEVADVGKQILAIDSANLLKVERIISQYGFPSPAIVGEKGVRTVFLVLQHAPVAEQKKYLPVLTQAYERNELDGNYLAYFTDKILMHEQKKQLYGTQFIFDQASNKPVFYPIEDEKNVNLRRARMGLESIQHYGRVVGIPYVPPAE